MTTVQRSTLARITGITAGAPAKALSQPHLMVTAGDIVLVTERIFDIPLPSAHE
ncbi:hypothetical protein HPP92_021654 [Vanilla planifolia]|uniref:Uncharacterized protein n=1 Tax=Vanilla planifolia TaxID=51239 RepID=A0A835UHC5_VANPL|nr:hypothetical protein HPP92_021974 [Vanilla planifolia]KAG0463178.1 hypothetical protein HPP92_021654 [Vanilla planifolia]